MPTVQFTANLQRHVTCPAQVVPGETVRAALEEVFARVPQLRGYVLDDQGAVRKHVTVFVDGLQIRDRHTLSDPVAAEAEIWVMQALSGG